MMVLLLLLLLLLLSMPGFDCSSFALQGGVGMIAIAIAITASSAASCLRLVIPHDNGTITIVNENDCIEQGNRVGVCSMVAAAGGWW